MLPTVGQFLLSMAKILTTPILKRYLLWNTQWVSFLYQWPKYSLHGLKRELYATHNGSVLCINGQKVNFMDLKGVSYVTHSRIALCINGQNINFMNLRVVSMIYIWIKKQTGILLFLYIRFIYLCLEYPITCQYKR